MTTPEPNARTTAAPDPRARLKKLSTAAVQLKLDLHDLAEELPIDWERIPEVATKTYETYAELARLRAELDGAAGAKGEAG